MVLNSPGTCMNNAQNPRSDVALMLTGIRTARPCRCTREPATMFQQSSNQVPGTNIFLCFQLSWALHPTPISDTGQPHTTMRVNVPSSNTRLRGKLQHVQCSVQSNEVLSRYCEQISYKLPSSTWFPKALKAADTFSYNKHFLCALCHFCPSGVTRESTAFQRAGKPHLPLPNTLGSDLCVKGAGKDSHAKVGSE